MHYHTSSQPLTNTEKKQKLRAKTGQYIKDQDKLGQK